MPHICAALTGLSGLQKKRLKLKLGEGCVGGFGGVGGGALGAGMIVLHSSHV